MAIELTEQPAPLDAIEQALTDLVAAMIDYQRSDLELSLDDLVPFLHDVRSVLVELRNIESELTVEVGKRMHTDLEEAGGFTLSRRWGKPRKAWRNDELRSAVLRAWADRLPPALVDPESGEKEHSWAQAIQAITETYNLAGNNVRTTVLKSLELDPDEFCSTEPAKVSVQFVEETSHVF